MSASTATEPQPTTQPTTHREVRPTVNDLEAHRAAITGHCYRMLGSVAEADDGHPVGETEHVADGFRQGDPAGDVVIQAVKASVK